MTTVGNSYERKSLRQRDKFFLDVCKPERKWSNEMSFIRGAILGLAGGLVIGLVGTAVATGFGISPHYGVNKQCLTTIEHLIDPKATGKILHDHLPSSQNIKHGDGTVLKNNITGAPYRDFLTFVDDDRVSFKLPRIATSNDVDGHLGEHFFEGLCVE